MKKINTKAQAKASVYYAGVLPYSFDHDGHLVYLLGREKPSKKPTDNNRWSDFGGSPEPEDLDSVYSAAREAYEESMGFLGTVEDIKRLIEINKTHVFNERGVVVFLVHVPYDSTLPGRYADVYTYIRRGLRDFKTCRKKGYFEKTAVAWVTRDDILSFPSDYRPPFIKTFRKIIRDNPILASIHSDQDLTY